MATMLPASELRCDQLLDNLRGDLKDEQAVWLNELRHALPSKGSPVVDVRLDVLTLDEIEALIDRYGSDVGVLARIGSKLIEYEELFLAQVTELPCGHGYDVACGCQVRSATYREVLHG